MPHLIGTQNKTIKDKNRETYSMKIILTLATVRPISPAEEGAILAHLYTSFPEGMNIELRFGEQQWVQVYDYLNKSQDPIKTIPHFRRIITEVTTKYALGTTG